MEPPVGFEYVRAGASTILVDSARRERYLLEGLSRPTVLVASARPRPGGRGGTMDLTIGGDDVVVRELRRGGLMRFLLRERMWSRDRVFREVAALATARARQVPAVQPLAAVVTPAGLGLHRQWLITLTVPGAQDLIEALETRGQTHRDRTAVLAAAAAAVRRGFDAGVDPPDLTPRNLLLTESLAPECVWVDLDRAAVRAGPLPPAARAAALARFVRYVETHRVEGSGAMSRADLLRFLRGVEGDGWRESARGVWTRVARGRRIRRAGTFWRPRLYGAGPLTRTPLTHAGPEAPLEPAVSVIFAAERRGEARRATEAFLAAAQAAGLRSFELIGLARGSDALDELRHLSPRAPALRYCAGVKAAEGDAWRALFAAARAPRIVVLEPSALDPAFLTEALERVETSNDVVTGVGAKRLDKRNPLTRLADAARDALARLRHGAPVRAARATLVARNDDRFQAAVRALRARRLARGELLGRLAESGARIVEIPVGARAH